MSQIETVVRGSKRVESLLEERLGASGRGLHEKVTSVEHRLPPEVSRSMRWIATVRNKVVHEEAPAAFDANQFAERVDQAVEWLTLNADSSAGTSLAEVIQSSATTAGGVERVRGKVSSVRQVGRAPEVVQGLKAHCVQIEIAGLRRVIELVVEEAVVINHGDDVAIAGEADTKSGKLRGYAYRNRTKGIFGQHKNTSALGFVFVFAGVAFCWAIFPLFFHLPLGLRLIRLGATIRRASEAVTATD